MADLGTRSGSQILRTFLPRQTADLKNGIYMVSEWSGAAALPIDESSVRRALQREVAPWIVNATDNGLGADLYGGKSIRVVELDEERGVAVERFPRVWLCPTCKRIGKDMAKPCPCGSKRWGQLHFVGFHSCGSITEPWIKRCPTHNDVKLVSPKSAKAADIRFKCPICSFETMKGLGFKKCPCGDGNFTWNVHKARTVYTPRGTALINPPRPDKLQTILGTGGAKKALSWVVEGMSAVDAMSMAGASSSADLVEMLVNNGLSRPLAEEMAAKAAAAGEIDQSPVETALGTIGAAEREAAEHDAVSIATATFGSRTPSAELVAPSGYPELSDTYRVSYPKALANAGLFEIDLVEQFPILNVMYGFTRGGGKPGEDKLNTFRDKKGGYRLHGDLSETEALLVRLDPSKVADWLTARGHDIGAWDPADQSSARAAILRSADIPPPGDLPEPATVGSDLLSLVHSYSHRLMRQTSVFAGIDRDALSEFLLPRHLAFFMYAAPRGDFVLGGMQSVFETNLDSLLLTFVEAERRCPLDPGCSRGSGACSGCLHVGEPSCRFFNTFLDRLTLFGPSGYLG